MKLLAILAAFFVLANGLQTREVWPAGKEFIYEYKARVIAGIPAIKQQLTGFGIKSIVKLQVVSPNTILVKMTELESGRVNNEVPQAAPQVYRGAPGFNWSPIQGESEEVLKVPFKINLRNGLVTNLEVVEDEPTWSVNIKKGLASQINVNLQQTNRIPFQLRNAKKFEDKTFRHLRTPSSEDSFFSVEEDCMGGTCKTIYNIVPLENYIATRQELDLPREILLEAASDPAMRPYMVIKVRDFDECERQPSWVHMNMKDITEEPCNPALAMCHKFSTRTSISRFLLRKSPTGEHMRVERVWGENEFVVMPHGVKTERLWSVSNQTLVLLNERPISSRINLPSQKLTTTTLRFEFPVSEAETLENPRLNEDPTFQGLRLPHKQSIGETKEKTGEREEAKRELKQGKQYGGGSAYGGQYGSSEYQQGGYGSKHGRRMREGEESGEGQRYGSKYGSKLSEGEEYGEAQRHGGKYGSKYGSRNSEESGKYGRKYGSKHGSRNSEETAQYGGKYGFKNSEESARYGGKYAFKRGGGRRSGNKQSWNKDDSSESSEERQDYENPEGEPEPYQDYDNEYNRRDVESRGERYYETRVMKSEWARDLRRYYPSLKRACYYISPQSSARVVRSSNIKGQIEELIHEVVSEISNFEDLAEKESALKILQVARAVTILSYDEIADVYHRVVSSGANPENIKTKKTLMLDAIAMSGTHPAIMFIRDLVVKGEVKGEMAAQVISTIPLSVKVITPELLSELIEMVQSPQVRPSNQPRGTNQVWITSLLAIGNMINFGCISPRTKNFNYPKEPRGAPLCSKNDPIIVNEFIPLLRRGLEKSEGKLWKKMVFLHALGNVGHPEVIPVLEACITGEICRDPQIRTKAVNALTRVTRIAPSKVYKVLRPVYSNQKIHYAIRMAAFQTLLYCKPSPAFFTAVATDTWFEPNQQVGSFVYTTLAGLANNTVPVYQNISRMAGMALPLAKKLHLGAQYSRNILLTNYIPEDQLGSYLRTTIFGSSKSLIPRFAFTRLIHRAGGFNLDMLQAGFYAQGVQEVVNKVLRALSPAENKEQIFSMWNRVSESWHRGEEPLGVIARELNVRMRKDDPMSVMAWFKLYGGMERLVTADYRTLLELVNEITPSFTSDGKVGVNMKINYQRAFNPDTVTVILPTDIGVPVFFTKKTPILVSVRGHITVEGDMPSLHRKSMTETAEVKIDLRPVISQNVLVEMGVICPATQEAFIAGVNTHNLLSMPIKTKLRLNIPEKKLSFEIEPSSGPLPRVVSLAHAHQRPFTVVKKLDNFMPITKVANVKYMHVVHEPHRNETIYGEEVFGLPIRITSKVDRPFSSMTGRFVRAAKQNPVTMLSFMNVPHSLRAYEYRVQVDLARVQTKRVVGHVSLSTSATESPIYSMEPESELESKRYKHKSEHFSSTEQDILSFLKNPSPYWSQGESEDEEDQLSYSPTYGSSGRLIRSRKASQKYASDDEEEDEDEEDVQIRTKSEARSHVLHAEVEFEGPVPRVFRASVLTSSSPDNAVRKISAQFEKEGGQHRTPYKGFVTAMLQFPRLPRTPLRKALLNSEMTSLASITARFGRNTEHAIKAKVVMARTNKQRRIAEESPAAKRCKADEAKGMPYSSSCMRARLQATTLNKYVIDVESQNLPKGLLNVTYHLDSYLKHYLFPYLSVDPSARHHNPQNKFRAVINVESPQPSHPYPVVDILTHKPHENAFFKTVKISPMLEAFFPLSAKTPLVTKVLNNYLGYKYTPTCRVGEEAIQTFDNVTVNYPLPQCYHLIAKDCSRPAGVSVLGKQGPQGEKIVKVIMGTQEITLVPTQRTSPSKASVVVKINGSPVTPLAPNHAHEIKVGGQVVLKITKHSNGEISVSAPSRGIKVISDGLNIQVEASNMLRGRLCGLCGDFNGEKMAELKGPRGCVHISPLTFGPSYAVPSDCSSLPKIQPAQLLKHLEKKQWKAYERAAEAELTALAARHIQSCNPDAYEPAGESISPVSLSQLASNMEEEELFAQVEQNPRRWSNQGRWEQRSESARPCVRYITKVVVQGNKTCFSVKPIPECNLNCKPSRLINKMIGFHCKQTSEVSDAHMSSARFGIVEAYLGSPTHMSSDLSIPDSCEMLTV